MFMEIPISALSDKALLALFDLIADELSPWGVNKGNALLEQSRNEVVLEFDRRNAQRREGLAC